MKENFMPQLNKKGGCFLCVSNSEDKIYRSNFVIYDSGNPTIEPDSIGQHYIDIKNKKVYISCGFDIKDWVLVSK